MTQPSWSPGPSAPHLAAGEVHVWLASLSVRAAALSTYLATLRDDERERAARYHFNRDRDAYIAGRGILRELLGRYFSQQPSDIKISYSDYGKPYVVGASTRFNLAHAGGLALFAFAQDTAVGVDLEQERELDDALAIAKRFFSPVEWESLAALPSVEQRAAFFRIWSRKEAFIKAVGQGLSYPLDSFEVTAAEDETRLLRVGDDSAEAGAWSLLALPVPAGYAAALAVRLPEVRLCTWRHGSR